MNNGNGNNNNQVNNTNPEGTTNGNFLNKMTESATGGAVNNQNDKMNASTKAVVDKEGTTLADYTLEQFMTDVSGVTTSEAWMALLESMAYDGFSVANLFATLKKSATTAGKSAQQFLSDISLLLTYGLQQGPNIGQKYLARVSNKDVRAGLLDCVRTYHVKDGVENVSTRVNNGNNGSETVTIGRLLVAFSLVQSANLHAGKINPIVRSTVIDDAYCHANGAGCIPKLAIFDTMFEDYINWSVELSDVLGSKNKKYMSYTAEAKKADARRWANIARNGTVNTEMSRLLFIAKHRPPKAYALLKQGTYDQATRTALINAGALPGDIRLTV